MAEIVVFHPEQIKSTDNIGTYDPNEKEFAKENNNEENQEEIFKIGGDPDDESPKMPVNWDGADIQMNRKWDVPTVKEFLGLTKSYEAVYPAIVDVSDLDEKLAEEEPEEGEEGGEESGGEEETEESEEEDGGDDDADTDEESSEESDEEEDSESSDTDDSDDSESDDEESEEESTASGSGGLVSNQVGSPGAVFILR
jgi:hypothetical protein